MKGKNIGIVTAILAAVFYGISAPFSKVLLQRLSPTLLAALLYLGVGLGMLAIQVLTSKSKAEQPEQKEARITKKELPFVLSMIILDIAAPIFLMLGISTSSPASVALLNNFEIVVTSLIALLIFKEAIGKRMWIAIALVTISTTILSVDSIVNIRFSMGSVFVLLACLCWGFENNCTRMLSLKDPMQIVVIKGFGSGFGALLIAVFLKEYQATALHILAALLLGFVAYGLSIYFYILAQRELGAARTSAYYAVAPFIGVLISFLLFKAQPSLSFGVAFGLMLIGTYFGTVETHDHEHTHERMKHEHKHRHDDLHHTHKHDDFNQTQKEDRLHHTAKQNLTHAKRRTSSIIEHSHMHTHEEVCHAHPHTPDLHHVHSH